MTSFYLRIKLHINVCIFFKYNDVFLHIFKLDFIKCNHLLSTDLHYINQVLTQNSVVYCKKKKKNLAKNTMSYRIKEEDFLLLARKGNRMFCEFGFQLRQGIKQ